MTISRIKQAKIKPAKPKLSKLDLAYQHCQYIARKHYENFPVASLVLPARLRKHVAAANTTAAPAPAPSVASDNARQLASLASLTGWPMAACMSACSGMPLRQVELQFFIRPDAACVPGVPMPTVMDAPAARLATTLRACTTSAASICSVAA